MTNNNSRGLTSRLIWFDKFRYLYLLNKKKPNRPAKDPRIKKRKWEKGLKLNLGIFNVLFNILNQVDLFFRLKLNKFKYFLFIIDSCKASE